MIEPESPVYATKDGIKYPPEMVHLLKAPYKLGTNIFNIPMTDKDIPVYFKQKQEKISIKNGVTTMVLIAIVWAVGKTCDEGKQLHFVNKEGKFTRCLQ